VRRGTHTHTQTDRQTLSSVTSLMIIYTSLFDQKEQQARKQTIKATSNKHIE